MIEVNLLLLGVLVASVAVNVYLTFFKKTKNRNMDINATELMHDLTYGRALVEIRRVAPESVFLHSPRNMK